MQVFSGILMKNPKNTGKNSLLTYKGPYLSSLLPGVELAFGIMSILLRFGREMG